jgi:hypothetical protein
MPQRFNPTPATYREEARKLRETAGSGVCSEEHRAGLQRIAEQYEQLARSVEGQQRR